MLFNWAGLSHILGLRMLLKFGGGKFAPSRQKLAKQAFFSPAMPLHDTEAFQSRLCANKSLRWPFAMTCPFAGPADVLHNILPGEQSRSSRKLLILAGRHDRLITPDIMFDMVARFRGGSAHKGKQEPSRLAHGSDVEFLFLDAAHHMQNDVNHEDVTTILLDWYVKMNFGGGQ